MREKKAINTMPKIISGTIMGKAERYSTAPWPRSRTFVMPKAPSVPTTPAAAQLAPPSTSVLRRASNMARSRKSRAYHCSEKPPHTELILLSLKE